MTDFSYTTNIPFSTDNPSADQPNMSKINNPIDQWNYRCRSYWI